MGMSSLGPWSIPKQKPGRSRQDYGTPVDFINAVEARYGELTVDLAATKENTKADVFISPEEDSLQCDWAERFGQDRCWLNPPFANIEKWAAKCAREAKQYQARGMILLLTPASIGAKWFAEHVFGKAYVFGLVGRLTFAGETAPYPKDCMFSVYGRGIGPGFGLWRWK